ncbi:hypothetical protein CPT_Merlin257 [Citrobacter phage Merlin]|uniref:Uncharacterized protein n=1 Tax=Citrobacter phage Merlin TaxID=1675602 RepID=A0A0K1LNY2_9CAUD|nr:hypothetical protein CPT_Merlin257 [Citrobacter phage Merlin]AKU43903.1 hypothetical protein CPT_Merlin257 [Citrobacter phage Merlin]
MKTVFVNENRTKEFGATLEQINPIHLVVGSKVMVDGWFYIVDDSFVSVEHNKTPEMVVVVHKA